MTGSERRRLNPKVKDVEPKTLLYKVPGGISNLLSQLTEQGLQDKYEEVLREVPKVQADLAILHWLRLCHKWLVRNLDECDFRNAIN